MYNNGYQTYADSSILDASPLQLVRALYKGAIEAVNEARAYLLSGEIELRSKKVTKAMNIISELLATLNHEQGGEVSANLGRLYVYMQGQLWKANCEQSEAPLVEVAGLLTTLLEAWQQVEAAVPQSSMAASEEREEEIRTSREETSAPTFTYGFEPDFAVYSTMALSC